VSGQRDNATRETLRQALSETPDCIEPARLGGALTERERDHVTRCPRCQTELLLLEAFESSTTAAADGAAVQWVVAEVRRRRANAAPAFGRNVAAVVAAMRWRPLGLAAAAMIAVAVGYLAWDRAPQLRDDSSAAGGYRTLALDVISPVGDVSTPPTELTWLAVPGAARYDIRVLQVDRAALWATTSFAPRVALPPSLTAQFVPGKTVIWEVSALDLSGSVLAVSGEQRFRVAIVP
jgi:hypothetical protein